MAGAKHGIYIDFEATKQLFKRVLGSSSVKYKLAVSGEAIDQSATTLGEGIIDGTYFAWSI